MQTTRQQPQSERGRICHLRPTRRPFVPAQGGTYKLPRDIRERLTSALEPYRNRDEAYALALHLARHWSSASRLQLAFPVVRRTGEAKGQGTWGGLCDVAALGLSQGRIRGARDLLETVGFLDRTIRMSKSRYRRTEEGGFQCKAVLFVFAKDYRAMFERANRRAAAARERQKGERRSMTADSRLMASTAVFSQPNLPIITREPEKTVLMGKLALPSGLPALAFDPNSPLDRALARLSQGVFGEAGALPAPRRGEGGG